MKRNAKNGCVWWGVCVCGGGGVSKNPTYEKANEASQLLGIPVLLLKQPDEAKTG